MDKFVSFEEAIEKLGISADRLNKLREEGDLRAYRDGSSWKFRRDEIEKYAAEGLPEDSPPSDISLVSDDELMSADKLPDLAGLSGLGDDLKLADELSLGDDIELAGSSLNLNDLDDDLDHEASELDVAAEDTVTAEGPAASDSILLSEEELGESAPAPASTIIGKDQLDADLDLQLDDEGSDVKLAGGAGGSHVLSSGIAGSGVLDELEKEAGGTSAFADLEELELDLSAESSRILSHEDVQEARAAADVKKPQPKRAAESDLQLEDLSLDDDEGTDPVPAAEEPAKPAAAVGDSDIDLASDDDFVLAEAGGSDITLDSADSGINLVAPSDSGLALDDIPLDVSGSAILSSLSLDVDDEISLATPAAPKKDAKKKSATAQKAAEPLGSLQADDDFNLTPMSALDDDSDSSSQVIALDADMEGLDAEAEGGFGFEEVPAGEEVDEFGEAGFEMGGYATAGAAVAPRAESEYSLWQILSMGGVGTLLLLSVLAMTDMVRNIWGWEQNLTLNSWLLDGILGIFGMRTQ